MTIDRRDFLKKSGLLSGYYLAAASPLSFPAKSAFAQDSADTGTIYFKCGVASADPQPTAVLLWTRVEPPVDGQVSTVLTVQVSESEEFDHLLLEKPIAATYASDFAVRVFVNGLIPDTVYYYRFATAEGAVSRTGRTWTAPPLESRRAVRIAFASCQSWPVSRYGVYRQLITAERESGERQIDLILHLGDYVYSLPEEANEPLIVDGKVIPQARTSQSQVSGGMGMGSEPRLRPDFETALGAHRRIYRGYLKDPDLQDARALYPFTCVWDDHEYENDVWQSYISGSGSEPEKRLAATQAWFEYVPQVLSESPGADGVPNEAHDFRHTSVKNERMTVFDEGFMSLEANNLAAINAMRCYRNIRWGSLVDLIITDNRSYRGPSANPGFSMQSIVDETGDARAFSGFNLVEGEALNIMSRGRTHNDGDPPATVTVKGEEIPNPRIDAPAVSMLGLEQKRWFKNILHKSDAVWKVWGNSVPLLGFRFDVGRVKPEIGSGYLWTDSWDGFPNEREELARFVRENGIENVVSLSGDRHANYAGLVAENYEADEPVYVIPDFTCTAISAFVRAPFISRSLRRFDLPRLSYFTEEQEDGSEMGIPNLNVLMGMGAKSAEIVANGGDLEQAKELANESLNPHLHYIDNDVHGYAVARFEESHMEVDYISVARPDWDAEKFPHGPDILRVVSYRVNRWKAGDVPELQRTSVRGEAVFGES